MIQIRVLLQIAYIQLGSAVILKDENVLLSNMLTLSAVDNIAQAANIFRHNQRM
jgi:hypothetical protein